MRYKIYLRKSAEKALTNMPKADQRRVYGELTAMTENPRAGKYKKLAGSAGGYRRVVWPYRILFTIDEAAGIVDVYRIAHRKEAYR